MRTLLAFMLVLVVVTQVTTDTGCASTSSTVKTMSGSFATCAKADFGAIVVGVAGESTSLLSDVAAIIERNATALEADLTALAVTVGVDAVKCAIAAVQAVIEAASAGSGSAMTPATTTARSPGLARALAWSTAR